jgi:hypothetical protein
LLLAAGKLRRVFADGFGQSDETQQIEHARLDLVLRQPAAYETIADIVGDAQVGEQRVRLEYDPEVAMRRRKVRDFLVALENATRRLYVEPGDRAQQRGLAAPRRAEEADEFAGKDLQRNVLQRGEHAELLGQPLDRRYGAPSMEGAVTVM